MEPTEGILHEKFWQEGVSELHFNSEHNRAETELCLPPFISLRFLIYWEALSHPPSNIPKTIERLGNARQEMGWFALRLE